MSATQTYRYVPQHEWAETFARVVAARTAPVPARAEPGHFYSISPPEKCEVCGKVGVFTLLDDGAIRFLEIHEVRIDERLEPGQSGWLQTRDTVHRCGAS